MMVFLRTIYSLSVELGQIRKTSTKNNFNDLYFLFSDFSKCIRSNFFEAGVMQEVQTFLIKLESHQDILL